MRTRNAASGTKLEFVRKYTALAVFASVYIASLFHIARVDSNDGRSADKIVLRLVHVVTDRSVQQALGGLAQEYEKVHPDIRVDIQTIPLRAYEQWLTTQLMGGTAPDLVQILGGGGHWTTLSQYYMEPLTDYVNGSNYYNGSNGGDARSWRESFVDQMEAGYFTHLLDYYMVPLSMERTRIIYNKDLFRDILGVETPPGSYAEWMDYGRAIRAYSERVADPVYPMALAAEHLNALFFRYFPQMTGGLMEDWDIWHTGHESPDFLYYGLVTGTFDLKQERMRAGFELARSVVNLAQPSYSSDQVEQVRMLFVQQRAAMILGEARDLEIYRQMGDFEVGAFDFPQVNRENPRFGRFYVGPDYEGMRFASGQFAFGITRNSRLQERALDFLKFATSREVNERFCAKLSWVPVVRGASLADPALKVFRPSLEGVINYPDVRGLGPTALFFDQHLPLYLDGQLGFEGFMNRLEEVWLSEFAEGLEFRVARNLKANRNREYNLVRAKAAIIFKEGGTLSTGEIVGSKTRYQLGVETSIQEPHIQYVDKYVRNGQLRVPVYDE